MTNGADALLAQIGRIAVVWSTLELQLKYAIGAMLGVDPAATMPLVADLPANQVLDRIRVISAAALTAAQATELKTLCDDLDKLREQRNKAVHSSWLLTVGEPAILRLSMTARKGYVVRAEAVRFDDLRDLGDELEQAAQRTRETIGRVLGLDPAVELAAIAGL